VGLLLLEGVGYEDEGLKFCILQCSVLVVICIVRGDPVSCQGRERGRGGPVASAKTNTGLPRLVWKLFSPLA
jgi:hypothetical protein